MEEIGPIQNREISTLTEGVGLKKLNQIKKAGYPKKRKHLPDAIVVARMVKAMNNYLNSIGRCDVQIKIYKVNGEIIISAISKEQGTIIKTIRPENLLNLNTGISEMVGFLINATA